MPAYLCPVCGHERGSEFAACDACGWEHNKHGSSPANAACPDCSVALQPIKLIDATGGPGRDNQGLQHVELSYAAPDASRGLFLGKIPRLGVVTGLICPQCGRILLYGEQTGAK
jgi:hypothetical protein